MSSATTIRAERLALTYIGEVQSSMRKGAPLTTDWVWSIARCFADAMGADEGSYIPMPESLTSFIVDNAEAGVAICLALELRGLPGWNESFDWSRLATAPGSRAHLQKLINAATHDHLFEEIPWKVVQTAWRRETALEILSHQLHEDFVNTGRKPCGSTSCSPLCNDCGVALSRATASHCIPHGVVACKDCLTPASQVEEA